MTSAFQGKVALVSGGGSGIGAATALLLASRGASVVVSDISEKAASETVERISSRGGKAVVFRANVSKAEDAEASVEFAKEMYGGLHLAFNNAGIVGPEKLIGELSPEDWQGVIDVNLNGVFYGLRYEIPAIIESGGGAIVNTSSIAGLIGISNIGAYVASKHAVAGLTKSAALDYAAKGVRINSVHPGYIETPLIAQWTNTDLREAIIGLHPIGRMGKPEEIANVVAFLLSDEASFMIGAQVSVDGGYTTV